MAKIFRVIFFAVALLAMAPGCSDEECPTCPTIAADRLSITGQIMFYGEGFNIYAVFNIMSISGETWPEIDSLTVAGEKVELHNDIYNDIPMFQVGQAVSDPVYSAGDTIDIVAYTPYGVDICRIALVDYYDDHVSFYEWESDPPHDTVDVGEGFEVAWSHHPLADGYRCIATYLYDSTGWNSRSEDFYSADTVYNVQPDQNQYNGYWLINATAATGMTPDGTAASVSGAGPVLWNVICRTEFTELVIYVGSGNPGGDI